MASTMAVLMPRRTRFSATSTPMNPPPMMTALVGNRSTSLTMRSTSSTVRSVNARSIPGSGGTTAEAPGLRISLS